MPLSTALLMDAAKRFKLYVGMSDREYFNYFRQTEGDYLLNFLKKYSKAALAVPSNES